MIVSNTRAMEAAIALADHLDVSSIIEMQATLLGDEHPEWVGKWRDSQVWIGGRRYGPHGSMFTPPHHPYTDLLLSSVPEMDPDWLTDLLQERGVDNIGDAAADKM